MARIRSIKPEFFIDEDLQDLEADHPGAYCMMVFAGLWGHCSKDGVFEYKPRTLKLHILPFLSFEMVDTLSLLEDAGFIRRFCVDGREYGYIPTFGKHQRISGKEAQDSPKYPVFQECFTEKQEGSNGEATGKQEGRQERKGKEREKERSIYDNDASSQASDTPLPPTPVSESSSSMAINEFRAGFQEATGQLMPGGCNRLASELCRRYSREQIKGAFETTALQGGRTLRYVEQVLEGKPKADLPRGRDRPSKAELMREGFAVIDRVTEVIRASERVSGRDETVDGDVWAASGGDGCAVLVSAAGSG